MAVTIPHGYITPSQNAEALTCMGCSGFHPRWLLNSEEPQYWCAYCLLYKTSWGETESEPLAALAALVSKELGFEITDANGQVKRDQADRIIMAIVMSSAYAAGKSNADRNGT